MSEEMPVKKALERDPDFAGQCLLQVLTKFKYLIPDGPVQEGDVVDIDFKIQGREYSFQEFMARFQMHYEWKFEKAVNAKAREMVEERFQESLEALADTAHEARRLFLNKFPELKTNEENERW